MTVLLYASYDKRRMCSRCTQVPEKFDLYSSHRVGFVHSRYMIPIMRGTFIVDPGAIYKHILHGSPQLSQKSKTHISRPLYFVPASLLGYRLPCQRYFHANGIPMYTRVRRPSTRAYSSTAIMSMATRALLSSKRFSTLFNHILIYILSL